MTDVRIEKIAADIAAIREALHEVANVLRDGFITRGAADAAFNRAYKILTEEAGDD